MIFSIFLNVFATKLEFFDGREILTQKLLLEKQIIYSDKHKFNKEDVFSIRFNEDISKSVQHKAPQKIKTIMLEKEYEWIFEKALEMEKRYTDASGIILLDKSEEILKKDGSRVYRYNFIGKILKDDKKYWAELAYGFEPGRSRINIVKARSIHLDKTVNELNQSDISESIPSNSESSIDMNKKVLSAVIPNSKTGSFIEYIVEIDTYNPYNKDFFFPSFGFLSSEPVYISEFNVSVPEKQFFQYVTRNMNENQSKPEITLENGFKNYKWRLKNVSPMISEPYSPGYYEIAPNIQGSSLKDWKEMLLWEKQFLDERIIITPEIEKKTIELTKDLITKEEKLARLYHWNQQEIRYISIKSGIGSGWSGHKAQITFNNKFGDCIDKAILFSTMAKVVGIYVVPIGLLTNDTYEGEYRIPHLNNNHAIVKVYLDGREFYLDPTSEDYRYPYFRDDDHGVKVHNSIELKIDEIPLPDIKDEAMHFLYYMTLSGGNDLDLLYTKRYSGSWEAGARGFWKNEKESFYEKIIKSDINIMKPGAYLKRFRFFNVHDISKPFYYFWEVNMKDYAVKAGDLLIFEMPWAEKGFSELSLDERKYPLAYSSRQWITSKYVLNLPDNITVKYMPDNFAGWYKDIVYCNSSWSIRNNTIIYTVSHKRMKDRVYTEDYKEYKKFLEDFVQATKQKLILVKKNEKGE